MESKLSLDALLVEPSHCGLRAALGSEDCGKNLKNPLQIGRKTGFVHGSGRQAHASTGGSRCLGASAVSLNVDDS